MTTPGEIRAQVATVEGLAGLFRDRAELFGGARDDAGRHLDELQDAVRAPDAQQLVRRATATLDHVRSAPDALSEATRTAQTTATEGLTLARQLESALRRAEMARHDRRRAMEHGHDPSDADRDLRQAESEAARIRESWQRCCQRMADGLRSVGGELGRITGRLQLASVGRRIPSAIRGTLATDALRDAGTYLGPAVRSSWYGARLSAAERSVRALQLAANATPDTYRFGPPPRPLDEAGRRQLAAANARAARSELPSAERRVQQLRTDAATNRPLTRAGERVSQVIRHPAVDKVSKRVLAPLGMAMSFDGARRDFAAGDHFDGTVHAAAFVAGGLAVFPPTAAAGAVTLGAITAWQHRDAIKSGVGRAAEATGHAARRVGRGIKRLFGGSTDDE